MATAPDAEKKLKKAPSRTKSASKPKKAKEPEAAKIEEEKNGNRARAPFYARRRIYSK